MAERHQILYAGFSKPGYYNNRSTVSDHGKLNSSQPFNKLRDLKPETKQRLRFSCNKTEPTRRRSLGKIFLRKQS
jgi:hypothetical protein